MATAEMPPDRLCGKCGGTARAFSITRWSVAFVSVSSTERYRCDGCSKSFAVEPPWTILRNLLGAALMWALAVVIFVDPNAQASSQPVAIMFGASALITVGYTWFRRRTGLKNPVKQPAV